MNGTPRPDGRGNQKEKTMSNEITLNHGMRTKDGWTKGVAVADGTTYDFQVKHYDEPSEFGIGGGRVSKLWLRRWGEPQAILSYDRGWDRGLSPRGKGAEVGAIYTALLAEFNGFEREMIKATLTGFIQKVIECDGEQCVAETANFEAWKKAIG